MGRPPKRNLNYSTWDVDVLENDTSIDALIDAQGPAGFYVYFALCQKAYATDGYFYRWGYDNAASTARKLWNRRQRAFGNRLYLESSNLQYASMSTKLALQAMVDRGSMLPNEWRAVLGLAPVAGGDEPIRRLDTQPVKYTKAGGENE